jgi:hypothetical protein
MKKANEVIQFKCKACIEPTTSIPEKPTGRKRTTKTSNPPAKKLRQDDTVEATRPKATKTSNPPAKKPRQGGTLSATRPIAIVLNTPAVLVAPSKEQAIEKNSLVTRPTAIVLTARPDGSVVATSTPIFTPLEPLGAEWNISPSLNPVDASSTYEIPVPLREEEVSLRQRQVAADNDPIDDDDEATDIGSSFEEETPKWHIIEKALRKYIINRMNDEL